MKIWKNASPNSFDKALIEKIFKNEISFLCLDNFAEEKECENLKKELYKIGFDKIGITQFEAKEYNKDWYFKRTRTSSIVQSRIFLKSFNPIERLINLLKENNINASLATENSLDYFCGLVRQINSSALIHADYAPFDAPEWTIGKIKHQLAFNLCLEAPRAGGECIVYNKPWSLNDDKYKLKNSYGYDKEFLKDSEYDSLSPKVAGAYLFNCRNFHEVKDAIGEKLTVSCFLGMLENGDVVLWS